MHMRSQRVPSITNDTRAGSHDSIRRNIIIIFLKAAARTFVRLDAQHGGDDVKREEECYHDTQLHHQRRTVPPLWPAGQRADGGVQ